MHFAQHVIKLQIAIGDHTGASYLHGVQERKLMSAWHNSAMPQCITRITNHTTDIDIMPNRLGTRLVTTMTVTIPPQHMVAIMPLATFFSLHMLYKHHHRTN